MSRTENPGEIQRRPFTRFFHLAVLAIIMALSLCGQAAAQVLYSTIVGTVKDPSGAAVPGATVNITQQETGFTRNATTGQGGEYSLPSIPAGTYTVAVSKPGFKTFSRAGVAVTLNTVARVDVSLEVGAATQFVEVKAAAPLLTTDRADVHSDLSSQVIENVPLPPGNNYEYLFGTIPGINPPETAHSIPTNPSRALQFNVNGTSEYGNDVRIDGVSQFNIWVPENTAYVPSYDAIRTVNVVTGNFNPEQGLAGGSSVNVQIKSGTNQLHGDIYEQQYDNALEAHSFFDSYQGITRVPKDVFNQFGGSVGGPIKKDKVFFFSNVEFTRERQFATRTASVPTPEMIKGDLRGAYPGTGLNSNSYVVYDPTTSTKGKTDGSDRTQIYATNNPADTAHYNALCASPKCVNVIPTSRISPVAAKLMALFQQASGHYLTSSSTSQPDTNYLAAADFSFNRITTDDKIDWNATDKFNMYGHLGLLTFNDIDPQEFGQVGGEEITGYANEGHGYGHTITFGITGNYVASPNLVIDGNFGVTRMVANSAQLDLNKNEGTDVLGIPGTNATPGLSGNRTFEGSWPRFEIHDLGMYLGTHNHFMPYFRNDPQFFWSANVTKIIGPHQIRFGGSYFILHLNQQQPEWNAGGSDEPGAGGFEFTTGPTACKNCSGGKGSKTNAYNDFGTFLLGLDTSFGKNILIPGSFHTVTHQESLYVGDQWQATRKLTATLGVRWEYYPMPTRGGSRGLEHYDFASNEMQLCGIGNVPTDCGVSVSKTEFAPRVGLAYRITPTFVARAGYGITNEPYNLADDERTNFPVLVPLYVSANSYQAASVLDTASMQNLPYGTASLPVGIAIPTLPDLSQSEVPVPGNVNLTTTGNNLKRGYIQSWNFTLEKELPHAWVAQAGYVATRTIRQLGYLDLNAESPIRPSGCVPGSSTAECGTHQSQALNFNYATCPKDTGTTLIGCRQGSTTLIGPTANNHYDSLQTKLEHHFANGYQVQFAYTWSKTIGMANIHNEKQSAYIQTPEFYNLNRGLAPQDRRHNFSALFVAQPPFGEGRRWATTGVGSKVLGGWQVSGILRRVSGSVFEIHAGGSSSSNLNATVGNTQRPDIVSSSVKILNQYGPNTKWFDTSAFAPVTDLNRFGTSPFYPLHGPPLFNLDLGLARNFKLTERFALQFRAQAINFTNTPHFGSPNGDLNSSSFGRINDSYANTGREVGNGRQFEFFARLTF